MPAHSELEALTETLRLFVEGDESLWPAVAKELHGVLRRAVAGEDDPSPLLGDCLEYLRSERATTGFRRASHDDEAVAQRLHDNTIALVATARAVVAASRLVSHDGAWRQLVEDWAIAARQPVPAQILPSQWVGLASLDPAEPIRRAAEAVSRLRWPVAMLRHWTLYWVGDQPTPSLRVPLVGSLLDGTGFLADLSLTPLDSPAGELVEDPEMALRPLGPDLLATVRQQHARRSPRQSVCWSLMVRRKPDGSVPAFRKLTGNSLGAAAAVGFQLVGTGGAVDPTYIITAAVNETGEDPAQDRLAAVGDEDVKLREVLDWNTRSGWEDRFNEVGLARGVRAGLIEDFRSRLRINDSLETVEDARRFALGLGVGRAVASCRFGMSNLSPLDPGQFVNREEELLWIKRELLRTGRVVLHGAPGTGKSELAKEYGRRRSGHYPGGRFFFEHASEGLASKLAEIGESFLGMEFPPGRTVQEQAEGTFSALCRGPNRALLIYDNVVSAEPIIKEWLPPEGAACDVLITTLLDVWDGRTQLREIRPFDTKDSRQLILIVGGEEVERACGADVNRLSGGLPVQIVPLAAALAAEERRGRLEVMRQDLARLMPEAFDSFAFAYRLLGVKAKLLLHAAAFLRGIEEKELERHLTEAAGWKPGEIGKHLEACLKLHLLSQSTDGYVLHQVYERSLKKLEAKFRLRKVLTQVRQVQGRRLVELARKVAASRTWVFSRSELAVRHTIECYPSTPETWVAAEVNLSVEDGENIAGALSELGLFADARAWHKLAIKAKRQGVDSGRVDFESLGRSLHAVGECWQQLGRFPEARNYFRFAIREKEKGDVHGRVDCESVGGSLHALGECWRETRRFPRAREYFQSAVRAKEKGDLRGRVDHASLGRSLHAVGECWQHLGWFPKARNYFRFAIREKEKGDVQGRVDCESVGGSLHALGECWLAVGRPAEARDWLKRAIAAHRRGDSDGHVDLYTLDHCMRQLGKCLARMGRVAEARKWYKQADGLRILRPKTAE